MVAWLLNLVFLRRRHRASRVARVSKGVILDLECLLSQMASREAETNVAREYSVASWPVPRARERLLSWQVCRSAQFAGQIVQPHC